MGTEVQPSGGRRDNIRVPWSVTFHDQILTCSFCSDTFVSCWRCPSRYPCSDRAPMSVFTLLQRALPSSLPWKRRHSSINKGKEREVEISSHDTHEDTFPSGNENSEHRRTTLQRDVFDTMHIAVKMSPDSSMTPDDSTSETPETASDSGPEYQIDQISDNDDYMPTCTRVSRLVRWASIVRNRDRWTKEQENQLLNARAQLTRCQKAWSSEQELWLDYVRSPIDTPRVRIWMTTLYLPRPPKNTV